MTTSERPAPSGTGTRARLVDAAVVVACLVGQVVVLHLQGLVAGPAVGAAVASAVPLWWWRRAPLAAVGAVAAVTVVGLLAGSGPAVTRLAAAVALYGVASRQPTVRALVGYAVAVGAPVAASLGLGLWGRSAASPTLLDPLALLALAAGAVTRGRRDRRTAREALVEERVRRAASAERARVTAELHDAVAHHVTVMAALAGGARSAWQTHPERAREALEHLSEVAATALDEMQRVLRVLRDDADGSDLAAGTSLDALVEVFAGAGMPVRLRRHGPPLPDDPALNLTLHRVVREALTNTMRHAHGATAVTVAVTTAADAVEVAVTDDGRPHHGTSRGAGVGLAGIRRRVAAHAGTVAAGPRPEGGWAMRVRLPLDAGGPR